MSQFGIEGNPGRMHMVVLIINYQLDCIIITIKLVFFGGWYSRCASFFFRYAVIIRMNGWYDTQQNIVNNKGDINCLFMSVCIILVERRFCLEIAGSAKLNVKMRNGIWCGFELRTKRIDESLWLIVRFRLWRGFAHSCINRLFLIHIYT